MKAIVIVAVAVATLIGLGWYFANSHVSQNPPTAQQVAPHAPEAGLGPADMHPEADGSQFHRSGPVAEKSDTTSNPHGSNITFEGAQLPNGSLPGRDRQALGSHKKGQWDDENFKMPSDDNEVVGRYKHREMKYEKAPSVARNVKMDDDLLIMEGDSEDRLSATR